MFSEKNNYERIKRNYQFNNMKGRNMEITLNKRILTDITYAPPSKSVYHRALICAALSGKKISISPLSVSHDVVATVSCLKAIGVNITTNDDGYIVDGADFKSKATIDCKECGSTFRFMLPLCAALGIETKIIGSERLAERPIMPLASILINNGISLVFEEKGKNLPLSIKGSLTGDRFEVPGNISSQYITGLMFAIAAMKKDAVIYITENIESAPYIDVTVNVMRSFGFNIDKKNEREYHISAQRNEAPNSYVVEGDFSNGAFWLCAAAISDKNSRTTCKGINFTSKQGDKKIVDILGIFGADVTFSDNDISVKHNTLHGIDINASDIPDLVPILSVVASVAKGKTTISGIKRLKIKESNRILSTVTMIKSLGGKIEYDDNNIYIEGREFLDGGTVDSFNDHRIAMSAAIASLVCEKNVTILGAEAVNKSYPEFFDDFNNFTKE